MTGQGMPGHGAAVSVLDREPVGWHPAVDELAEGHMVYATSSSTVRLTEPFAMFVAEAGLCGVRPVLLTTERAQISPFVSRLMRKAGGVWAVQTRDCTTYDALSGYRVDALPELWGEPTVGRDRLPGFDALPDAPQQVVTFDVHTGLRAEVSSRVGVAAETIGAQLDARWQCMDLREPLLAPWDVAELTRAGRRSMPESPTFLATGTNGAYCQVQVARTRTGLLEHTVGGIPVPEGTDLLARATGVALALVEAHNPTVAIVSIAEYDRDVETGCVVQTARRHPLESPLVVLVGARAVRGLGVDPAWLAREHDVRAVGRAKVPCLMVRFDGDGPAQRWAQLVRFREALGVENIVRVLGGKV